MSFRILKVFAQLACRADPLRVRPLRIIVVQALAPTPPSYEEL
jgi:hypothetical protein